MLAKLLAAASLQPFPQMKSLTQKPGPGVPLSIAERHSYYITGIALNVAGFSHLGLLVFNQAWNVYPHELCLSYLDEGRSTDRCGASLLMSALPNVRAALVRVEVRRQVCGVSSLLLPSHGFQ